MRHIIEWSRVGLFLRIVGLAVVWITTWNYSLFDPGYNLGVLVWLGLSIVGCWLETL